MADRYFLSHFPQTTYNNTAIVDISRRVSIEGANYKIPNMFYPVTIQAGTRTDTIADIYYNDPEQDWLIYLSNQIVDPYYQWYLSDEDFQSFIIDKYGDAELPQQKIKYYRNNWSGDDTRLTPSYYNNTLSFAQKQYYGPVYGPGSKVIAYIRKPIDWLTNTNAIYQYTVTYTTGNTFTKGELVKIHSGATDASPPDGKAEVVTSNSTTLILNNISGNVVANSVWTKTIVGNISSTSVTTNLVVVLQENITNSDADFWESVSFYDWENERNEQRKSIQLLNPSLTTNVSNAIRDLLKE